MESVSIRGNYEVRKSSDELQNVYGWASVAVHKDGTIELDAHQDVIDPEDLELAAYQFVLDAGGSGEDHAGEVDGHLIESVVFTDEKLEALGIAKGTVPTGWWVGFHLPDPAAYERAKVGKTMFSIEGTAFRELIDGA